MLWALYGAFFKKLKLANHQKDTFLLKIKDGKKMHQMSPKSVDFFKIALHSNCFYQKLILHFYILKGDIKKTKTDELGINGPIS